MTSAAIVGADTILDYGCGKSGLWEKYHDKLPAKIIGYDPAIPALSAQPEPADLVVCTDVLEHVEPECLETVLDDLRRCTIKGIFLTVSFRPAMRILVDGRNAHLIQEQPKWWLPKIMDRFELRQFAVRGREFAVFAFPG